MAVGTDEVCIMPALFGVLTALRVLRVFRNGYDGLVNSGGNR